MEWFGLIIGIVSSVVAVVGAAASVFRRLERLTIEDLHGAAFLVVLDDAHTKFQPYLYLELALRNRLRNDVHIVATGLSMGHIQCVPDYDAIETIEKHSGGQNEDADKSVQISYYGTSIPTTLLRTQRCPMSLQYKVPSLPSTVSDALHPVFQDDIGGGIRYTTLPQSGLSVPVVLQLFSEHKVHKYNLTLPLDLDVRSRLRDGQRIVESEFDRLSNEQRVGKWVKLPGHKVSVQWPPR